MNAITDAAREHIEGRMADAVAGTKPLSKPPPAEPPSDTFPRQAMRPAPSPSDH
jgi:hypothetical protein